jgi:hypothetical protein
MKKDTLTLEKAKKSPAGGVLVGKREGQTMIYDDATVGGYFVGKLHKEGGIQGINKTTGQPIEVQSSEVIITAPAVADQTKREFQGEMLTNREILSKINVSGGGVSLEQGGDVPSEIYFNGSSYNYGGKTMTDYEIMQEISNCGCEHEYDNVGEIEKLIKEGQIDLKFYKTTPTHAKEYGIECKNPIYIQTLYITKENRLNGLGKKTLKYLDDYCKKNGNDVIFGHISNEVEFTKDERTSYFSDVELMKYWLHDNGYAINDDNNDFHKVVNVKYNNGGQMNLAEKSKKGDHPSRDLNNYNDVLDMEADGMVGAETGLAFVYGGEIKNKFNSYDDFVKQNIGKYKLVITVGSGGTSQPMGGATKESIDEQFKSLIFHNFKDYEFSGNYMSENLLEEYNSFILKYYNLLIENPKEFVNFWNEFIIESGNYDSIYKIRPSIYDENGKYIESREWVEGKWVKNNIPHYPDLIFSKYKKEMSSQLIKEYQEYLEE